MHSLPVMSTLRQVNIDAYDFYSTGANIVKSANGKKLLIGFANIELKHNEPYNS